MLTRLASVVLIAAAAGLPASALAQQPAADTPKQRHDRLMKAIQLPKKAEAVRARGVPADEMRRALNTAKAKGVKPDEMSDVADEHRKALDEHGPIDNFGAFVQSKLDQGLRGRELAQAIRDEHAKRGIGKGKSLDKNRRDAADKTKDREKADKARDASEKAEKDKADKEREQIEDLKEKAEKNRIDREKADRERGRGRGNPKGKG